MLKIIHTYNHEKYGILVDLAGPGFLRRDVPEKDIAKCEVEQSGPFLILRDEVLSKLGK